MLFPPPQKIQEIAPLSRELRRFVQESRRRIQDCISDRGKALVIGPCSLSDEGPFLEYADLLSKRQKNSLLVLRAYFEKPRTSLGWNGYLHEGASSLEERVLQIRRILLRSLSFGLPLATEFVQPLWAPYFIDCISWVFIGARTVTSPYHRQFASSFSFPCGMKNDLSGNPKSALDAVHVAQNAQSMPLLTAEGLSLRQTEGNPYAHIVLRGSADGPNDHLCTTLSSKVLIDCSHGNGRGSQQLQVAQRVLRENPKNCIGLMAESFLLSGSQENPLPGQSRTDPCLNWQETEELIALFQSWDSP